MPCTSCPNICVCIYIYIYIYIFFFLSGFTINESATGQLAPFSSEEKERGCQEKPSLSKQPRTLTCSSSCHPLFIQTIHWHVLLRIKLKKMQIWKLLNLSRNILLDKLAHTKIWSIKKLIFLKCHANIKIESKEKIGFCPFQKNNPAFCPTFQTN